MVYFYLILSAALVPILNNFFPILKESYSFWLVPLLVLCFFIVFILLHLAVFFLEIIFTNLNKPCDKGAKRFRFLLETSLPIIVFLTGVKIVKSGIEKLPKETRMLLVCNHQHDFDPAVILSVFAGCEIGFIGKKEIYTTMPLICRAMHRIYSLPLDRENDREAAKTIIKAVKNIKEDKASMAIFPEGFTSPSCELLPFRNGAFKIATKANVPIVVCVLNNTREIPKNMFRRKTVVEFKLIDVIYPEQYKDLNTAEIGEIAHKMMNEELLKIRKNT